MLHHSPSWPAFPLTLFFFAFFTCNLRKDIIIDVYRGKPLWTMMSSGWRSGIYVYFLHFSLFSYFPTNIHDFFVGPCCNSPWWSSHHGLPWFNMIVFSFNFFSKIISRNYLHHRRPVKKFTSIASTNFMCIESKIESVFRNSRWNEKKIVWKRLFDTFIMQIKLKDIFYDAKNF